MDCISTSRVKRSVNRWTYAIKRPETKQKYKKTFRQHPPRNARTQLLTNNHIKIQLKRCTVFERQGLPQFEQTRFRTASVDSTKLVCFVNSACSCASSTDFRSVPQSPHFSETPAIAVLYSDEFTTGFGNFDSLIDCLVLENLRVCVGIAESGLEFGRW